MSAFARVGLQICKNCFSDQLRLFLVLLIRLVFPLQPKWSKRNRYCSFINNENIKKLEFKTMIIRIPFKWKVFLQIITHLQRAGVAREGAAEGSRAQSSGTELGRVRVAQLHPGQGQAHQLWFQSTEPGPTSQGSAPRAAAEFSSLRQGLIQVPLKSIKASHWSEQWLDQGHTDVHWKPDTRSDYFSTVTHQILIHSIIYRLANKQEILLTQSHRLHLHPWLARWELEKGLNMDCTESAGCSKAIRQHKEIEMEFLGERDH